jgi:hypothetical protein
MHEAPHYALFSILLGTCFSSQGLNILTILLSNPLNLCYSFRTGVSNLRPAQPFYSARHMTWELANARRAKRFCHRWEHWYKYTVSKCKGKQSQKKEHILMKQIQILCRPISLTSRCCAKIHCYVAQTIWNSRNQFENDCGINSWSFIKLKVTWNQNCNVLQETQLCGKMHLLSVFKWIPAILLSYRNTVSLTVHDINFFCGPRQRYE